MNILFLAPHPFFQERGTPIAVDMLVRTLAERGDTVALLTYHEGEDRAFPPGVRHHRIKAPPGCRNIRPGFSLKKILCDLYLYRLARRMVRTTKYDVIHAVEESVFIAMHLGRATGTPYVFDMDSSMPTQMADKHIWLRPLLPILRAFERRAARKALAVAAVCDALADLAVEAGAQKVILLRDVPLLDTTSAPDPAHGFRIDLGLTENQPCILYIGNLEPYQGVDLLVQSFARLPTGHNAHLVIVGGIESHIQRCRRLAESLGVADRVHLTGPRPIAHMAALMADADILASPRTQGSNTPMKIYSYMAAGKAILATDLPTHTQVLDTDTACLAAPDAAAFALAMNTLIRDADLRARLGHAATQAVEEKYSPAVYRRTVNELYDWIAS